MRIIESYNASYPLAYYQIGTVYAFYGTNLTSCISPASADQISRSAGKLAALIAEEKKPGDQARPNGREREQ